MIFDRWRRQRDERIEASEKAAEKTERLALAVSPLLDEARQVTSWAERRIADNHLADLFTQGARGRR